MGAAHTPAPMPPPQREGRPPEASGSLVTRVYALPHEAAPVSAPLLARMCAGRRAKRMTWHAPVSTRGAVLAGWDFDGLWAACICMSNYCNIRFTVRGSMGTHP